MIGLIFRAFNLIYNGPSGDEAIYVVVGQLGIFGGDWFFYNASSWLSGSQFLYPSLSGIAYALHGIWASRMLSVIAGTILTLLTYFITIEFSKTLKNKRIGALVAASVVATATTALYVSRLATMDAISYVVFFGSILLLQQSLTKKAISGQKFFVASLLLILSSLIKSSVIFFYPLLLAYGIFATHGKSRGFFIKYYMVPLMFAASLYVLFNTSSLIYFSLLQAGREKSPIIQVVQVVWESIKYLLPLSLISSIIAAFYVSIKKWLFLFLGALWMILIHIATLRVPTLDKHLLLSLVFIAVLTGIGTNVILGVLKGRVRFVYVVLLVAYVLAFGAYSYKSLGHYNSLWTNSTVGNNVLAEQVGKNDKVLTETGPATVLTIFPKVDIENISTFDYLKYGIVEGEPAYKAAVKDGYFNYIELESASLPKSDSVKAMHQLIIDSMDSNYDVIYKDTKITIYKRAF